MIPSRPFHSSRFAGMTGTMKDADRDNDAGKKSGQTKSALKGAGKPSLSLENRVAQFLAAQKESGSLGELSRKLGIPRQSLTRYLNSEQSMTLGTLQKIASVLGVTTEEILGKDVRKRK